MDAVTVVPETPVDKAVVPANAKETPNGGISLDTTTPPKTPEPVKPAWEQHGFKSADEMGKAYGELRTKMSKDGAPAKPAETVTTPTPNAAIKTVTEAGLDLNGFVREFAEKGELSADSLKALSDKGINKETVDQYIAGVKAQGEKLTTEVQAIAGGAEEYGKMLDWAQTNMTDDQVESFNKAVHSGDMNQAKLAVKGLLSDFRAAVGTEGKSVTGQSAPAVSGIEPFGSQQEMVRAIQDPRYKSGDPAYIAQVARRIEVSKIFG